MKLRSWSCAAHKCQGDCSGRNKTLSGSLARCELSHASWLRRNCRVLLYSQGCQRGRRACSLNGIISPLHSLCSSYACSQNSWWPLKRVFFCFCFPFVQRFFFKIRRSNVDNQAICPGYPKGLWIQIMQPWSRLVCDINLHFHCCGNKFDSL